MIARLRTPVRLQRSLKLQTTSTKQLQSLNQICNLLLEKRSPFWAQIMMWMSIEYRKRATFLFRQAGLSYFIGRVKDSSRKRDKKELKFKHEEVSANRKELEESSAKIRDAASSL